MAHSATIARKRHPSITAGLRPRPWKYLWHSFGSASFPGGAAGHPFHDDRYGKDH